MKISKIKETYNDYKVEMSWGQLQAIKAALERDHADPVSDEAYAEIAFYLDKLPGPGEEEEDLKARDEMAAPLEGGGSEEGDEQGDYPVPMPPGHEKSDSAGSDEKPESPAVEKPPAEEVGPESPPADDEPVSESVDTIIVPEDEADEDVLPPPPKD